jgi:hypothetical protein
VNRENNSGLFKIQNHDDCQFSVVNYFAIFWLFESICFFSEIEDKKLTLKEL